jgi:hypothetical protein
VGFGAQALLLLGKVAVVPVRAASAVTFQLGDNKYTDATLTVVSAAPVARAPTGRAAVCI